MIKNNILSPFQKFVKIESFSGYLLLGTTLIALIWANSGWGQLYQSLWSFELGIESEKFYLVKPLILWINDGLMAIFFFLIGLEIKRELLIGELNSLRKAALPMFAAAGGMFIPLFLFIFLNSDPETSKGWGIPMATDIAFTLAILNLLGRSVPLSLKVFLTAFAIVDDLGAVLVIAIFYSGGIDWTFMGTALLLILFLASLSYFDMYVKYITFILGLIVWVLFLKAGVHPTIAGVLLAFTIPIHQRIGTSRFVNRLNTIVDILKRSDDGSKTMSKSQIEQMDNLEGLIEEYQSPLQHLEHKLHSWVAYVIIPVFALANAGVVVNANMDIDVSLAINIAISLFIGKFIGVTFFSYASIKMKWADLPPDLNMWQISGVAILSGVGFTMSIFIATLAFSENSVLVDSSKIGILVGSLISGIVGALILKVKGKEEKVQNN